MLVVCAVFWAGQGLQAESFGALLKAGAQSPGVTRVLGWIFTSGEGHYEGMEVLKVMGLAVVRVLLPFHLIATVIRAFRPDAPVPKLGVRLKRLFWWNLALLGLFAFGAALVPRQPGTDYLEMVFWVGVLVGTVFVPAAVLLAISTGLEQAAESFRDRPADDGR